MITLNKILYTNCFLEKEQQQIAYKMHLNNLRSAE